ncbi:insulinase family protein [Microbacterium enclense]|uniref:M16 family metallopeptidase n=1 Tax=Microbacterium enclense TaxID=993073 RepID=UPI00203C7BD4|nr:insulinase family protein [Microbacterium enclense]MCM3613004.1 insulinase family protein [Microbacterium enclense]
MAAEYELTSHDGIPVFSLPDSPLVSGALVFAVGRRDETPRSAGLAHLVEHLVMDRARARGQSVNAFTSDDSIAFVARGDADLVVRFLRDAARAISTLSSITPDEIVAQQKVIAVELGEGHSHPGLGALSERFGAKGLGLLDLGAPAHTAHGVEEVVDFVRRWLHRENAAVVVTGLEAGTIDVSLPAPSLHGSLDRDPCTDTGLSGYTASVGPGVTLSLLMQGGPSEALTLGIAGIQNTLMNELRHERHLVYAVDVFVGDWSTTALFAAFHLEVPAEKAAEVAAAACEILRRITSSGVDPEARREAEEDWRAAFRDPEARAEGLLSHAVAVLRGTSRPGRTPIDPSTVSEAALATVLSASMPTLLVSVEVTALEGDDAKLGAELQLAPAPLEPPFYATLTQAQRIRELSRPGVAVFSPRLFRGLRGHRLVIDDERVTYFAPETGAYEIIWREVVLARRDDAEDSWTLVSSRGGIIGIDGADWRGSGSLRKVLDERIPVESRFVAAM